MANFNAQKTDKIFMQIREQDDDVRNKTLLLRKVVELLMWELSAISNRQWEDLPELKKQKTNLADRIRLLDWMPRPEDREQSELMLLKSQVSDLEYQSRKKIQAQMEIIKTRLAALQDQQQNWLECLRLYCRKSMD